MQGNGPSWFFKARSSTSSYMCDAFTDTFAYMAAITGAGMDGSAEPGLHSERIRNALTDAIAAGDFAAGTTLDEQLLADRYGVSRTPVREALRQLAASGLVEIRPRRGVVVAQLTPQRIGDMFETSAEVEALCARLAAYRMTPLERGALMDLHEESAAAVISGDVDAYDRLNRAFHEALYAGTHNGFLAEQALALRERLGAFRRTQLRQGDRIRRSRDEHGEIVAALAEGDGESAARRMRAHMLRAAAALGRYIAAMEAT
jgi:DNA-binding GntR family transcriptional regulator